MLPEVLWQLINYMEKVFNTKAMDKKDFDTIIRILVPYDILKFSCYKFIYEAGDKVVER